MKVRTDKPTPAAVTAAAPADAVTETVTETDAESVTAMPRLYTRKALLQMPVVFLSLGAALVWQWEVVHHLYLRNPIGAAGWAINGGIMLLFCCGLARMIARFLEYHREEGDLLRFTRNLREEEQPLQGIAPTCMAAARYRILQDLGRRRAAINHNALAAALLASESSRNSFLKFVHNALILSGVFGTIVSLSLALLGATDMIRGGGQLGETGAPAAALGAMIFAMSTALSTTMTAVFAYLVFGYFYIKLTDTQTYLISRIEELTATTLLPPLQVDADSIARDYSDGLRSAEKLIKRLESSQKEYEDAARVMVEATRALTKLLGEQSDETLQASLARLGDAQQSAAESRDLLVEVVRLLQEGFRLRK
ncbi:MAG: hypothetical protein OD918_05440 [Gammaproteobacteria bacterium]